ncbi:hypothetical protein, partial [Pantoea stewartii]
MDEKSLYAHILNLSAPWQVKSVALLNKWILCCGTMKTVVSDNIKSMHYMLAYDGVLSGISVFYQ